MDTLWRFIFNSAGKVAMSSVTHCIQKERFSHTPQIIPSMWNQKLLTQKNILHSTRYKEPRTHPASQLEASQER